MTDSTVVPGESPVEGHRAVWRRSSACVSSGCVELAEVGDSIVLRDSKTPVGPILTCSRAEFRAFVEGVKAGSFDDLCR
jgi:hypothetical protein